MSPVVKSSLAAGAIHQPDGNASVPQPNLPKGMGVGSSVRLYRLPSVSIDLRRNAFYASVV